MDQLSDKEEQTLSNQSSGDDVSEVDNSFESLEPPEPQWITGYLEKDDGESYTMEPREIAHVIFKSLKIPASKVISFDQSGRKIKIQVSGDLDVDMYKSTEMYEVRPGLRLQPMRQMRRETWINVERLPFETSNEELVSVLTNFGRVIDGPTVEFFELDAADMNDDVTKLLAGVKTTTRKVCIELERNIPSFILVGKIRAKVWYQGQEEKEEDYNTDVIALKFQAEKAAEQELRQENVKAALASAAEIGSYAGRERLLEKKELRDIAAQRRKAKEEDKLVGEKVKAQLEQVKLEKRIKFQAEKAAEEELRMENEKAALASAAEEAERRAAKRATSVKIQFRLPDGSSQTKMFPSESPLSEVYNFVRTGLTTKYSSFSLSTTSPRRNLDTLDMSNTLKNLQLAPSATVMVLPTASSSVSLQDGGFLSMIWLLLTPFTILWTMLTGRVEKDIF